MVALARRSREGVRERFQKLLEQMKDENRRYSLLRWAGSFAAGTAILSLMIHLIFQGGRVNQMKCVFFCAVLIVWFVAMPLTAAADPSMLPIRPPERLWAFQRFLIRQVYPYAFFVVFLWFALAHW
jgi:hypothetical protein